MSIDTEPFLWMSAARSHPGCLRQLNEDAYLAQPEHGLWAVADGLGGHFRGDFASRLAVQSLVDLPADMSLDHRSEAAVERLRHVNRRLRAEASDIDVPMIGTTIVALIAAGDSASCLWAGDSRIYRYRDGRLTQLTRDHNHVEAARARQAARPGDTIERPLANLITRALGAEDTLEIERIDVDLRDGDLFLLCSDGVSNAVSSRRIEEALLPGLCRVACEDLIEMALERGCRDNVTAVVARAEDAVDAVPTLMRLPDA